MTAIPLPNGVAISDGHNISICWLQEDQYLQLIVPTHQYPFSHVIHKIPIIRGIYFLLTKIIYQSIYLCWQKLRLPPSKPPTDAASPSTTSKYIYSFLIIIGSLVLIFLLSILWSDNILWRFILLTLSYLVAMNSLVQLAIIWVGSSEIRRIKQYHHAIYSFLAKPARADQIKYDCPVARIIFILLFTTYLNSFLPMYSDNMLINILISMASYLIIFGILYDIYWIAAFHLNNHVFFLIYLPIILLKKQLKLPSSPAQKKAIEIAYNQLKQS